MFCADEESRLVIIEAARAHLRDSEHEGRPEIDIEEEGEKHGEVHGRVHARAQKIRCCPRGHTRARHGVRVLRSVLEPHVEETVGARPRDGRDSSRARVTERAERNAVHVVGHVHEAELHPLDMARHIDDPI